MPFISFHIFPVEKEENLTFFQAWEKVETFVLALRLNSDVSGVLGVSDVSDVSDVPDV